MICRQTIYDSICTYLLYVLRSMILSFCTEPLIHQHLLNVYFQDGHVCIHVSAEHTTSSRKSHISPGHVVTELLISTGMFIRIRENGRCTRYVMYYTYSRKWHHPQTCNRTRALSRGLFHDFVSPVSLLCFPWTFFRGIYFLWCTLIIDAALDGNVRIVGV